MGTVYRASQVSLNRPVAVKVINTGALATPDQIKRFRVEAEVAAGLTHPNIVPIFEIGEHDGHHYFSMGLVRGPNLRQRLAGRPMPTRDAAALMASIARAVHHAHQRGVLHRDLKPSNIVLDPDGAPHLTDFGLAKMVEKESTLTHTNAVLGTPSYMAPEQAQGKTREVTTATDVYGLGAVLYETLTGKPPFAGETSLETIRQVLEQEPPRPSQWSPTVDRDLETICLKCLEKEPRRRYGSAEAVADELDRWARHEPISARRSTTWERVVKWSRRKPQLAASIGAVALVVLSALGAIGWQWRHTVTAQHATLRALAQLELEKTEEQFNTGASDRGLRQLSRILRRDPGDRTAAARLMAALTQRNFALPLCPPIEHRAIHPDHRRILREFADPRAVKVPMIHLSPDGARLLVAWGQHARVYDAATGTPVSEISDHPGFPLSSASFSPDGNKFITASVDGTARAWDAFSGAPLLQPLSHHGRVWLAVFSPAGDRIATASADRTARLWDARTGDPAMDPMDHADEVTCVAFSPDGRILATAAGPMVKLWDSQSSQSMGVELLHDFGAARMSRYVGLVGQPTVSSIEFSPDGTLLLTVISDAARVWDVTTGRPVTVPLLHRGHVTSAKFSPEGERVVTASIDHTVKIWDARTGVLLTDLTKHDDWVHYAEFSPEALRVVTAGGDGRARIFDAETGRLLVEPLPHPEPVTSARFSPDGQRVVTDTVGVARVWDIRDGRALAGALGYNAGHFAPDFTKDGKKVVTATFVGGQAAAVVWDTGTWTKLEPPIAPAPTHFGARISPDGRWIATAGTNWPVDGAKATTSKYSILLWESATGQPVLSQPEHQDFISAAEFSPDSRWLATASQDGTARVWETRTGMPRQGPLVHPLGVRSVQFSPTGHMLLTKSDSSRVWDLRTGQTIFEVPSLAARFSPDGRRLVSGSDDHTARIWQISTGQPVTDPLPHQAKVADVRFSTDGDLVLTLARDRTVRVWDARSGQPLTEPQLHGASWSVWSPSFGPNSQSLLIAVSDQVVRLQNPRTGQFLTEPMAHLFREPEFAGKKIRSAQFSPDGRWLVTTCGPEALFWSIPDISAPPPSWLAELGEAVAGSRLDAHNQRVSVPSNQLFNLRRLLRSRTTDDRHTRWGQWFFSDRHTRAIAPLAPMTTSQYLERRIHENTAESLREAVLLSPTNGPALARLAHRLLDNTTEEDGPRTLGLARLLARRASDLAPNDPEVESIAADVARRTSERLKR